MKKQESSTLNWMEGEISLPFATSAFGMEVNKPDVRYVFHVGVPTSFESWIQDARRAGETSVGILNHYYMRMFGII